MRVAHGGIPCTTAKGCRGRGATEAYPKREGVVGTEVGVVGEPKDGEDPMGPGERHALRPKQLPHPRRQKCKYRWW